MRWAAALLVLLFADMAVASVPTPVTNLRYYVGPDYARVVIDLGGKAEFGVGRVDEPGRVRIFFDLVNTSLSKELATRSLPVNAGLLQQVRIGQFNASTTRVVLDFIEEPRVSSFLISNPYRLVIDVFGIGSTAAPQSGSATPSPSTSAPPKSPPAPAVPVSPPNANHGGGYSVARQLGLGVHVIVLDAGHGGSDPGCISRGGVQEKTLTLDLAKKLKALIEKNLDCVVHLTREDDRFVPLEERTAISNSLNADLFVSIHVNSSRNRNTYGTETYFLNFATDEHAAEVAARENAMSTKNIGELKSLVQKITLNSKIDESKEFAAIMQRNLHDKMRKYNSRAKSLGVKQAPFYVLIGAQMPAILVEANFMSNSSEEKLLKSSTYRGHFAEAMLVGLKEYVATFNKPVATASAQLR